MMLCNKYIFHNFIILNILVLLKFTTTVETDKPTPKPHNIELPLIFLLAKLLHIVIGTVAELVLPKFLRRWEYNIFI